MAKVKITGHASGSGVLTVTAPNTSTDRTITLPDATATLATTTEVALKAPIADPTFTGTVASIISANNAQGEIAFGDPEDANIGRIAYNHPSNFLATVVNATEYMRIHSNGVTSIPSGVALGVGTANTASNVLDDYEEGTWTPTLTCSSSGSYTLDTGANLAAYTKIGRVVHVQASIGIASESSPNGNLRMSLPFTSFTGTRDTDNSMGNATLEGHGGTVVNGINIFVFGAAYAQFPFIADNGTFDYLDHSHVDTAFSIKFSFSYIAA